MRKNIEVVDSRGMKYEFEEADAWTVSGTDGSLIIKENSEVIGYFPAKEYLYVGYTLVEKAKITEESATGYFVSDFDSEEDSMIPGRCGIGECCCKDEGEKTMSDFMEVQTSGKKKKTR